MPSRLAGVERLSKLFASTASLLPLRRSPISPSPAAAVLLFGQSNGLCLRHAWNRRLFRPRERTLDFRFLFMGTKQFPASAVIVRPPSSEADAVFPELAQALNDHFTATPSTETWLVSVVLGNAYNVLGLFEPEPAFDFVHPATPDLPLRPETQLLPYEAIRAVFSRYMDITRRFYKCLPRQNIAGVIHLEAPPPRSNQNVSQRSIEVKLLKRIFEIPNGVHVSPREFRMKLWKCQSDVHREICAENDIIYLTPPEAALDGDGYLLPKAAFGVTHASAWYGALALKKIEAVIMDKRRRQ